MYYVFSFVYCIYDTVILLCTYVNVLNKIPTYLPSISINVAVLCVIRVGLVIVGTNPEEINASRRSRVMP